MDEGALRSLAAAARHGDEASFTALVEGLSRTLLAMAYRYTQDWESARDLTQETWLRVHRHFRRWDPDRPFTAWLYTIHRNGCRDFLRRPWWSREAAMDAPALERLQAPAREDPGSDMERREFRERILEAAADLSPSQREVFLRVDVEQGDQQAVARALGIRPGTLRVTLHAARKRVAAALRHREEMA